MCACRSSMSDDFFHCLFTDHWIMLAMHAHLVTWYIQSGSSIASEMIFHRWLASCANISSSTHTLVCICHTDALSLHMMRRWDNTNIINKTTQTSQVMCFIWLRSIVLQAKQSREWWPSLLRVRKIRFSTKSHICVYSGRQFEEEMPSKKFRLSVTCTVISPSIQAGVCHTNCTMLQIMFAVE